jgi:cytochrome P450 family 2 subfamily J
MVLGMEDMVQEELVKFRTLLESSENEPLDIAGKLNLPILNALWRVTAGEHFEYDNPFLIDLLTRMGDFLKRAGRPEAVFILGFPWIPKFWPSFLGRNEDIRINRDMMNLMKKSIQNHKETLDANEPRDYIDKYLIEIDNTKDPNSSFFRENGIENLAASLVDLFIAGSETTSTTLTWAVLYMVRNPEVQQKVQEELDTAIGRYKLPSSADKPNLPYTEVREQ